MPAAHEFAYLKQRLKDTPFAAWLGMELTRCDDDGVTIVLPMRPELVGSPTTRALHGGVFGVMIDTASSYAVMAHTGRSIATIDLRVDYHKPGKVERYELTGKIVKVGRTLGTADAWVRDANGDLLASGRGVFMHVDR